MLECHETGLKSEHMYGINQSSNEQYMFRNLEIYCMTSVTDDNMLFRHPLTTCCVIVQYNSLNINKKPGDKMENAKDMLCMKHFSAKDWGLYCEIVEMK